MAEEREINSRLSEGLIFGICNTHKPQEGETENRPEKCLTSQHGAVVLCCNQLADFSRSVVCLISCIQLSTRWGALRWGGSREGGGRHGEGALALSVCTAGRCEG